MTKSVLIIDDDGDLRKSLKIGLERENFAVVTADSAETAAEVLKRVSVDGIILDRMMTGADGLSFLRELRKGGDGTPVLMLTAMNGSENTIAGLEGGADDYLPKPFQLKELVLRVRNILRKSERPGPRMPPGLRFADGEFFAGKKLLALSAPEKAALIEMTAGGTARMTPMTAKRLRDKVLANVENADIITVRGRGYKLAVPK
ncbi:MAG: response regulator transcription factor [Rickettsiales bacterium]|jgi:DNA-binding response OmpR family regulator|nr:response regulator transcription factor [Rickettsiales bacterium]